MKAKHIENFICDLLEVYDTHQLFLSHQDRHGGFLVEPLSADNMKWLSESIDFQLEDLKKEEKGL